MRKWLSILATLATVHSAANAQEDSARLRGWEIPVAGTPMNLRYFPAGGPLEGKQQVNGTIYLFNNYHWQLDDVNFTKHGSQWTGSYHVPANCAFVAIKLTDNEGNADNNNDRGFVATAIRKEGGRLPGGALAWATFRKPSFNKAPGGYFEKFDLNNEALEMWIRKEMQEFPDSMPRFFDSYIAMLKISTGDEFEEKAPRNLEKFGRFHNITEAGYNTIYNVYKFQLKNNEKADSIRKVILTKYPKGSTARFLRYNEVFLGGEMNEAKMAAMEQFLKDFPISEAKKDTPFTQHYQYHNIQRTLAAAYVARNETAKLAALVPEMDFTTLTEVYHHNFVGAFLIGKIPIEKLYDKSVIVMTEFLKKRNDLSYMEDRYTPKQALALAARQVDEKLAVHIGMLTRKGEYKTAASLLPYISEAGTYKNASLNEARVTIFERMGRKKEVLPAMEASVRANAATPVILEKLKKSYKGKADAFDTYLTSLKPAVDKEKIKSELINEPYTAFSLENMEGKQVSSADWKDKIVVIDYWATWCFPCKAAFPGMQLAVNKFKNDPAVGFYFVATMERGDHYKADIKKYITSSGYTFNVLYDDENPATEGKDRVFKSMTPVFKSAAIPRKVILKNGLIRYTSEGYLGSPSGLADELSYVIELLKAEK
ncbi:TlpA family protein disulfide reductase [Chitinophaga horti]|uniref:TlpA family protein disulfide reductase n=1 Tax=Chitinophaga horti TaxID=2920382 RepID=A0ABY6J765_9BACT|nr:TlpA disulfide reductase family protein [Chitinophaga horti]UYQ94136.1 TlpA family protein disulfide reductase [Chitinophaga horti]